MDSDNTENERDRGIFTPTDRDILTDDDNGIEPGTQRERNVRMRLRERLENSLKDFAIALEYMEERDINKVINANRSGGEAERLDAGLESVIGLLHWQTEQNAPPRDFESLLERGVRRSMAIRHRDSGDQIRGYADVDFDVSTEVYNVDDLYQRYQDPESPGVLTMRELGVLRKEGLIESEDIGEYHEAALDSTLEERGGGFVSQSELGDLLDEWRGEDSEEPDS